MSTEREGRAQTSQHRLSVPSVLSVLSVFSVCIAPLGCR
jgi:hypothetical protein